MVGLDQFRQGGSPSVPLLLLQAAGVGQVDLVGQNPEIEGLLLREQPLPSGAVEGQPPQHLLTVDQVHLEAVVKPIAVALIKPIGGDGEPLLLPQNLAVPEKHRLPGMAEPGGVGLVDALDPALLHRLEGFRPAEGDAMADLMAVRILLNGNDAGAGVGDDQLQLGQQHPPQFLHRPADVDAVDDLTAQQEFILFHGLPLLSMPCSQGPSFRRSHREETPHLR